MSKLFTKIKSDIRSETGVRASERLETDILFNFSGLREDDGHLNIVTNHEGDRVVMTISAQSRTTVKDPTEIMRVVFRKDREQVRIEVQPALTGR